MIVDDHHALVAVIAAEVGDVAPVSPMYLDARIPTTMFLRLVAALHKPVAGRLSRLLGAAASEPAHRSILLDRITTPRSTSLTLLDDREVAAPIGPLTAEPGVSLAFAALVAHAVAGGEPILIDPANEGRWIDSALDRHVEVFSVSIAAT